MSLTDWPSSVTTGFGTPRPCTGCTRNTKRLPPPSSSTDAKPTSAKDNCLIPAANSVAWLVVTSISSPAPCCPILISGFAPIPINTSCTLPGLRTTFKSAGMPAQAGIPNNKPRLPAKKLRAAVLKSLMPLPGWYLANQGFTRGCVRLYAVSVNFSVVSAFSCPASSDRSLITSNGVTHSSCLKNINKP